MSFLLTPSNTHEYQFNVYIILRLRIHLIYQTTAKFRYIYFRQLLYGMASIYIRCLYDDTFYALCEWMAVAWDVSCLWSFHIEWKMWKICQLTHRLTWEVYVQIELVVLLLPALDEFSLISTASLYKFCHVSVCLSNRVLRCVCVITGRCQVNMNNFELIVKIHFCTYRVAINAEKEDQNANKTERDRKSIMVLKIYIFAVRIGESNFSHIKIHRPI